MMDARVEEHTWDNLFTKGRALMGLVPAVLYIIGRMALDSFYQTLKITAEEIGMTQSIIIFRTGYYLMGFLSMALVVAIVLIGITTLFRQIQMFTGFRMPPPLSIAAQVVLTSALAGCLLVALPFPFARPTKQWLAWMQPFPGLGDVRLLFFRQGWRPIGIFVSISLFVIFIPSVYRKAVLLDKPASDRDPPLIGLQWTSLAVLLVLMTSLTMSRSQSSAEWVREGNPLTNPLFNEQIQLVWVEWVDQGATPDGLLENSFVYLGQDKMVILYDSVNQQPIRIPIGKVVLRSHESKDKGSCRHPPNGDRAQTFESR